MKSCKHCQPIKHLPPEGPCVICGRMGEPLMYMCGETLHKDWLCQAHQKGVDKVARFD